LKNSLVGVFSEKEILKVLQMNYKEFEERKNRIDECFFNKPFLEEHFENLEELSDEELSLLLASLKLDLRKMYHCS